LTFSANISWSRSQLVDRLANLGFTGGLQMWSHDVVQDGLLWTGSAWYPRRVFAEGFQKTNMIDPGEDVGKWSEQIERSILANGRTYGFHTTTNPRVAAQFAQQHIARLQRPGDYAEDNCNLFAEDVNNTCIRDIMKEFQFKYGCPTEDSGLWKLDPGCYNRPCLRVDKMGDEDYGLGNLCPNWGYAYLVKASGVHVRVTRASSLGKDYDGEEEVFVPIRILPEEILGAIPIYARKPDGSRKNPGLTGFAEHWKGNFGYGKMTVAGVHAKGGKAVKSGIGAFIFNSGYRGDAATELYQELAKKGIQGDLGTAIPREVASMA